MIERGLDRQVTMINKCNLLLLPFPAICLAPIVDFRPYKVGDDIGEKTVSIPDEYRYGFGYENKETGEK